MNHINYLLQYIVIVLVSTLFLFYSEDYAFGRINYGIERPKLGMGLFYEFEEETRNGPNIDSKDIIQDLRARLEVDTGGWVYHKALCEYNLRLSPEWTLRKEEHGSERDSKDSFLEGYFADAVFLQYKPYSVRLFGDRTKVPQRSAFTSASDTETDIYGAQLDLKYRILPSTFSYSNMKRSQTGFFRSVEESDEFEVSSNQKIGRSSYNLKSSYEEKTRTTESVTRKFTRLNSSLKNTFYLTDDRDKILRSFLSHRVNEVDNSETSGFQIYESLDWQHGENLRTDYRLDYDRNETDIFLSDTISARAGLTHDLYENLTTRLSAGANLNDFTGGKVNTFDGYIKVNYRRRIPWGNLFITTGHSYTRTTRDTTTDFIPVIDEPHTLTTGKLTLLENENVVIASIQVTDITHTDIYIENVDYTVEEIEPMVRISRTLSGAISDGQPVLVRYEYQSNPGFDDDRVDQSYGLNLYLWNYLTLSYDYSQSKQSVISGIPPDNLIDDSRNKGEMKLEWGFTHTSVLYEDIDRQSGVSTTEWEVEERFTLRPLWQLFYSLEGSYGEREFKKSGEEEDIFQLRALANYMPFTSSRLSLEGFLYGVSGKSQEIFNTGLSTGFEIFFGFWKGRIRYEYTNEENDKVGETRKIHRILLEIVKQQF